MQLDYRIVIPARYASERLPGKPLRPICGKPMIEWVYRAALEADAAEVVVATDDSRIYDTVLEFGGDCCMTGAEHPSGSDRIVEVAKRRGWDDDDIVVNLQGDEPLMPPQNLRQVAMNLAASDCVMATLHKGVSAAAAQDPNLVKLVHDEAGRALYFSRAPIPFDRSGQGGEYWGHIGIYAYRVGFLQTFTALEPSRLERTESLEQLRALSHGYRIHSAIALAEPGPGVDTETDLETVQALMRSRSA